MKTKICPKCKTEFRINIKLENNDYVSYSNRKFCLNRSPKKERLNKKIIQLVIDDYPIIGTEQCQKKFNLTKNQIQYIIQKFNIKLKKETWTKIASKGKIKTNPEEYKVNHLQFL
mgnify:CR=1 FL=1